MIATLTLPTRSGTPYEKILQPSTPPAECRAARALFFFGSPFFVAAPLDSLDPAAILKLYDFCIFPFDKSQRSARAPFLLLPSFPLPIFAKSRSPEGAPRDLAKIGRGKEGKKVMGTECCRSKVRIMAELKDDGDSDAFNKERHAF